MSALLGLLEKAQKAPPPKVLPLLLGAWGHAPVPELAELIFAADAANPPPPFTGNTAAWVKAGNDVHARSALLAAWRAPKLEDCKKRLDAAAKWGPDPRTSRALEALLTDVPWTSNSARPVWTSAFALMGKLKDPRFAALKPAWNVRADQRAWLERAFAKAAAALPKPASLTAAEAKAIANLKPPAPKKGGRDEASLLADVYRTPTDDGPRQVLADFLQEKGDPRGELIALQCADDADPKAVKALVKKHGKSWLGALGPVLGAEFVFRRGFVTEGMVKFRHQADAQKHGARPEWATLESLVWSHPNPIPKGQEPWCRFIGPAFKHLRFADGPYVPHLLAATEPWALEKLDTEFEDAANLHALLASKQFPKLSVVEVQNSRVNALWISGATDFGAVKKLGFRNALAELVDAANRTPLVELRLGGAVLTRGADGFFSVVVVPKFSRIKNVDEFPGKLPAGAFEQVVCADAKLEAAFRAKQRKEGAPTPWSAEAKGPEALPPLGMVKAVGFTAADDWVVVERDIARVVDPKTRLVKAAIPVGDVRGACVAPDGKTLVVAAWRNLSVYDLGTGTQAASLDSDNEGEEVGLSRDGTRARLWWRGTGELWDLAAKQKTRPAKKGEKFRTASFDGERLVRWNAPPDPIEVCGPSSRKALAVLDQSGVAELDIELLPDGRYFGISAPAERMFLWDAKGALLMDAKLPGRPNPGVELSPDGSRVVIGVKETLHVFEVESLSPVTSIKADKWHQAAAWSRDGKRLLVAGRMDGKVLVELDATTGKPA